MRSHIRFGKTVVETAYDSAANAWQSRLSDGTVIASRFLVSASGLLIEPELPDIAGIDDFQGKLLHSARWDHDYDLTGKRVAVIGTGATAVQLIPTIADAVASLDVYQRTAIWLMGKPDAAISAGWARAFRTAPWLQDIARWTINVIVELSMGPAFVRYKQFPWMFGWLERKLIDSIRSQVDDPEIQEKLIPKYSFFCKRPSFSNVYYPVFNREHVDLITDPIECIAEHSIKTRDGTEREIDALVCATGYSSFRRECAPNFEVFGTNGRNLGDFWQTERYQAYQGASVPGFPNLFLMMGPYSAAGASYFTMIDTQTRHLERCLREARRRNANYVEVKQAAHDRDFQKVERRRKNTVLFAGDCSSSNSYYFDERGDTPGLRPVTGLEHWLNSRLFRMRDYAFERRPG